jgi:hypothetical protein
VLNYQIIGSREGYQWYASTLAAERDQLSVRPKGWYSLAYCVAGVVEEHLLDIFAVHILHGSASAHFIGGNSHSACLSYTSLFEALHKLSPVSRPPKLLCSFSEDEGDLNANELSKMFWGSHMGVDCGSGEGSLVIHSNATLEHLRSLLMANWPVC